MYTVQYLHTGTGIPVPVLRAFVKTILSCKESVATTLHSSHPSVITHEFTALWDRAFSILCNPLTKGIRRALCPLSRYLLRKTLGVFLRSTQVAFEHREMSAFSNYCPRSVSHGFSHRDQCKLKLRAEIGALDGFHLEIGVFAH